MLLSEEDFNNIPAQITLYQNMPNPFNATTTISYSIAAESNVELAIYNLSGQKVAEFNEKYLAPGTYSVVWNAANMASGMYYCSLRVNDSVETRKMLLVK